MVADCQWVGIWSLFGMLIFRSLESGWVLSSEVYSRDSWGVAIQVFVDDFRFVRVRQLVVDMIGSRCLDRGLRCFV